MSYGVLSHFSTKSKIICTSSACNITSTFTESEDVLLRLLSLVPDTQRLSKDFLK